MTLLAFRLFGGEIPRRPETVLPDNASQDAYNVELAHGELRGLRGDAIKAQGQTTIYGSGIKSIYTENGLHYWGWPFDVYLVKSLVVDDIHYRVYYTMTLPDGTALAKVARTKRNSDGDLTPVLGGNPGAPNYMPPPYFPPEATTPGMPAGTGVYPVGPDSWVLGVPTPKVWADIIEDNLGATLVDRNEWPDAPGLQLRATMFYEDEAGNIVYQQDISNNETVGGFRNVFYTGSADEARGNKIQDMLWPLGAKQRPYKFYFFIPPPVDLAGLTRPASVVNPGAGAATFLYESSRLVDDVPPKVIVA